MYYLAVDLITAAVQAKPELGSALLQHIAAGDSATAKKVAEQIWKLHTDPDLVITIFHAQGIQGFEVDLGDKQVPPWELDAERRKYNAETYRLFDPDKQAISAVIDDSDH